MDLAKILANMVTDEGLSVALIVGDDGLLVDGQCRGTVDLPAIGALASSTMSDLHHLGRTLEAGAAVRLRLRFEHYELLVESLTDTDLLVAGVPSAAEGERLLNASARYRSELRNLLGEL